MPDTSPLSTIPAPGRPRTSPAVEMLLAAAFGAAVMAFIQLGWNGLSGNDSYYHAKMALMLPEWGFVQSFPWLRWTIFNDRFVSHHHGFHVLLAPFVTLADRAFARPQDGAKLFVILGAAATAALHVRLLRRLATPDRAFWTLMLASLPWHFWLRQSYVRAPVVALPLLLLAVDASMRRRWAPLALLGFVFTHVYGGAVLLPLIPAAFLAADWVCHRPSPRSLRPLAATLAGVALGLVVNPYFPANFEFLWTQLFQTGLGAPPEAGTEWKPFDAWFLARISLPLAAVWAVALVARLRSPAQPADFRSLGLLFLNLGFLALTLKSRRFIEYWPVFALLNAADWWAAATHSRHATPDEGDPVPAPSPLLRAAPRAILLAGAIAAAALNLRTARNAAIERGDLPALACAMDFLRRASPPGSLVLTDDWDVFPECFFFNHHNHYAVGLDPVFTQVRFPELWERYRIITRGQAPASLPPHPTPRPGSSAAPPAAAERRATLDDVAAAFHADYVLVARDHAPLYRQLVADRRRFQPVFPHAESAASSSAPTTPQPPYAVFRVRRGP